MMKNKLKVTDLIKFLSKNKIFLHGAEIAGIEIVIKKDKRHYEYYTDKDIRNWLEEYNYD